MKLSNLAQRIITCLVGIPLLAVLIFFLPQNNFIGFGIFTMLLALLGSFEMSRILFGKIHPVACVSWIMVLMEYLTGQSEVIIVLLLIAALAIEIKNGEKEDFRTSLSDTSKYLLMVLYPSFFLTYIIKFLSLESTNSFAVLMYLLLVFSNDIFAYVFGMLFGRSNAGIVKVSPKKSLAGFIGGFVCCIALCFGYSELFADKLPAMTVLQKAGLGICISIFANVGDLAESVFKRSAGIKDSGNIVPGRGGVLDCIDSICTTAPFIYFFLKDLV